MSGFNDFDDPLNPLSDADMPELEIAPPPKPEKPKKRPVDEGPRPAEIQRVAQFPAAPTTVVESVPYAVTVFLRRRELKQSQAALRRRKTAAGTRAEAELAGLGRASYAARERLGIEGDQDFEAVMRRLDAAAGDAAEANDALSRAGDAAEAERAEVIQRIAEAKQALGPWESKEAKLATEAEVLRGEQRRLDAAAQRAEIELRNAAQSGADPDSLGAAHNARQAEAEAHALRLGQKESALAEARKGRATAAERLRGAEKEKKRLESDIEQSLSRVRSASGSARASLDEHFATLGEEVLAAGIETGLDEEARALRALDGYSQLKRELQIVDAALKSHDSDGLRQGLAIVAGASLLVLVTLVAMVAF